MLADKTLSTKEYRTVNRTKLMSLMLLAVSSAFYGCATTAGSPTTGSPNSGSTNATASREDTGKAEKKISMAIGEEVGGFSITDQQKVDAPAGFDGTQYSVKTKAGKTFKCEILEPSGFGKAISFGMSSGAGAMCTDFTKGSKEQGKTNQASCNALLKAAGKCN
jgi:hypothetical protein